MKYLSYATSALILSILASLSIIYWQMKGSLLNFSCSSYFAQDNKAEDFYMISNTLMSFSLDRKGFISMDGWVAHKGKVYKFRRDYSFIYKNASGNKWQLLDAEVTIAGSDDVPVGMIERNFFSTDNKKNGNYIYVAQVEDIKDAWIVGGLYTPAFICVNNKN